MSQLSGTDSLFLAMESTDIHGHVGGLMLLDPSQATGFGFARVRRTIAERVLQVPEFMQKLVEVPLGLARPYWVEDTEFEIGNHVRRIAVPSPGGMRELAEVCGYLFSQKLDRRRPLWEMWYIEGLAERRVALFSKIHHALMDGARGADLSTVLCDLEPNPAPPVLGNVRAIPRTERVPAQLELLLRGFADATVMPFRVARYALQAARRGVSMLPYLVGRDASPLAAGVPRLSVNGTIGPRRGFSCSSVPLADLQAIKNELGVKLNDVIVELTASALVRYLRSTGEKFDGSLAVGCPVSTRTSGDDQGGNRLAAMAVSCATEIGDPAERVLRIHRSANRAKEMTAAARSTPISSIGEVAPPWLLSLGFRALMSVADWTPVPSNAVVSNVPGPMMPLYTAGARIEAIYPISILTSGQALNVTALSFMDRVDFGFTVDPDAVRDPWYLAEGIPMALEQLRVAVERRTGKSLPRSWTEPVRLAS